MNITGSGATGNVVEGNAIGVDATGEVALSTAAYGVLINFNAANNTIGGTASAARNVISGNAFGVGMANSATGNVVEGNYIGTDSSGAAAVANGRGVIVSLSAFGNTIGGSIAGAGNVISGNTTYGLDFKTNANTNTIAGNYIGVNAAGTAALANGLYGILFEASVNGNTIGGTTAGAGNVISGNTSVGVEIRGCWSDG